MREIAVAGGRVVVGERKDRHHLAGRGDVPVGLPGHARRLPPSPHHDPPQRAIVHVDHPGKTIPPGGSASCTLVDTVVESGASRLWADWPPGSPR